MLHGARSVAYIAAVLCVSTLQVGHAQPDPVTPGTAVLTLEQVLAQREQFLAEDRKLRDSIIRGALKSAKVRDGEVCDAIASWYVRRQQHPDRRRLRQLAYRLRTALASDEVADGELEQPLALLKTELQAYRARRVEDLKQLDAEISYTTKPNLELALTMLGLVGDEASVIDGVPRSVPTVWARTVPEALDKMGVVGKQDRDSILLFVQEHESSLVASLRVAQATRAAPVHTAIGEKQSRRTLDELQQEVARHKARRAAGLERLDAKIGYTRHVRLEAALLLLGITSDDAILRNELNEGAIIGFKRFKSLITGEPIERKIE